MNPETTVPGVPQLEVPKPPVLSLRVFGVGGAGVNVANYLATAGLPGMTFYALDTNAMTTATPGGPQVIPLGLDQTRGLGVGGDLEVAWALAEKGAPDLRRYFEGADLVFLVAGLGRGTGTGVTPVLARLAREAGALVVAFAILPFDCEIGRRQQQARHGLQHLKESADGVICLPNQRLLKVVDEKCSLIDTFQFSHECIAQGLRGFWRLVSQPGLIQVDFSTICRLLRGQHSESSLATLEAKGPNRAREVVEKLLASPLLDYGKALTDAQALLVSLVGGPELTMSDVQHVMQPLNRQCPLADITLGAALDPAFSDRIELTVMVTRQTPPASAAALPLTGARSSGAPPKADLDAQLFEEPGPPRGPARVVPPPPSLPPEQMDELWRQQTGASSRPQRSANRPLQGQLPLQIVSKGRFDKSEPTVHAGDDLDEPTFIRRGLKLN